MTHHRSEEAMTSDGTLHIHIDGGKNEAIVRTIVDELTRAGYSSELKHVIATVAGPQRLILPEVYGSHTPGEVGEEFEYFSTTAVLDREEAVRGLRFILPRVRACPGIVVEAEEVVAMSESREGPRERDNPSDVIETMHVKTANPGATQILTAVDVGFEPVATWPYEVHHRFDVNKGHHRTPPIPLSLMLDFSKENGMTVGGWFIFDLGDRWGYRSNQFMQANEAETLVKRQNRSIFLQARYSCRQHGIPMTPKTTLTERVLGIWKT